MGKISLFGAIASILTLNAFADQVLTSRAYVDNADAQKVNIAQGVGTNNANVGKTLIVNSSGNLELGTVSGGNFIEDSITDGVTNKAPSENAVHDALADKQDTIETGLVDFNNGVADLPAIVTYDSTDSVTGNKIGILDQETIADDEGTLNMYNTNEYGTAMDNYVPTVRAVADQFQDVMSQLPNPLIWNINDTPAVNNYSTTFNSTTNNWPTAQRTQYVQGAVLANALALKQNKIPANNTTILNPVTTQNSPTSSVITTTGTSGNIDQIAILTGALYNNTAVEDDFDLDDFGNGTGEDMLLTAKAVINYGKFIRRHIKNCVRWLDNAEHTDANCLLWNLN